MTRKEAYQKKMEAQLDEWKADIDKLTAKANQEGVDLRLELSNQLREIRSLQEKAGHKLDRLKETGDDAWEDLREGIDSAWASLGTKIRNARSRIVAMKESEPVTS
jgi:hypothetical protein